MDYISDSLKLSTLKFKNKCNANIFYTCIFKDNRIQWQVQHQLKLILKDLKHGIAVAPSNA